jgi:hypothetical protein
LRCISTSGRDGFPKTYGKGGVDVLGEEDSLRLDDEEVDELVHITNPSIEVLPRNGVVLARSELGGQAVFENGLTSNLSEDGDAQCHPCNLEKVSRHVDVSGRKDERDDGCVGNGRGAYRCGQYDDTVESIINCTAKLTRTVPRQ